MTADSDDATESTLLERGRSAPALGATHPRPVARRRRAGVGRPLERVGRRRLRARLPQPEPARACATSASFYDVPMGVLLGEDDAATAPRAQGRLVLDLVALQAVPEAEAVLRYLRSIILERGDYNGRDPVGAARRPAGHLLAAAHRRGRHARAARPVGRAGRRERTQPVREPAGHRR